MFARAGRGLLVVALVAAAAGPAMASELGETRDELAEARTDLEDVERTVQRARDEVAAADERLREATTELETVRARVADAEEALAAADDRERATAAALEQADDGLQRALGAWEDHSDQLDARAIAAFKHGAGAVQGEVLMRGVTQAGDLHEIAVTLQTVDRLVTSDRELIDEALTVTRSATRARAEVTAARRDALAARRAADQERRQVSALLERQAAVVARVDAEAARHRQALAGLEDDAAARAVLVRDLERSVQRLESARLAALAPAPTAVAVDVDLDALGPPPGWASRLPAAGRSWAPAIEAAADARGIDARLLAAVVWTESAFRPDAVSHAGAIGLAQLMPATARGLGVDPRDPMQNLAGGATYLRAQLDTFGRADLALAAYNAGPGRVSRAGNRVPNIVETQLYVVRVLERYETLRG